VKITESHFSFKIKQLQHISSRVSKIIWWIRIVKVIYVLCPILCTPWPPPAPQPLLWPWPRLQWPQPPLATPTRSTSTTTKTISTTTTTTYMTTTTTYTTTTTTCGTTSNYTICKVCKGFISEEDSICHQLDLHIITLLNVDRQSDRYRVSHSAHPLLVFIHFIDVDMV